MGSEQSTTEGREDWPEAGYHVLNVSPGSPGDGLLTPFFDFIVKANDVYFEVEDSALQDVLGANLNKPLSVVVWNSRSESFRTIQLTPSDSWGGEGLLGVSIRFCPTAVVDQVWHVLEVTPGGPAAACGLAAGTDYIMGTPDIMLNSREDFFTVVSMNVDKELSLYVFSSVTDAVRTAALTPSNSWGGEGLLGCDVGYGYLHRIPSKSTADPAKAKLEQQKQALSQLQKRVTDNKLHGHNNIGAASAPATPVATPSVVQQQQQAVATIEEQAPPLASVQQHASPSQPPRRPTVDVVPSTPTVVPTTPPAAAATSVTAVAPAPSSISPGPSGGAPPTSVDADVDADDDAAAAGGAGGGGAVADTGDETTVEESPPKTPESKAPPTGAPTTADRRKKLADLQNKLKLLKEREKQREKNKAE